MVLRSVLFNALFYGLMITMMIVCAPAMLFGRHATLGAMRLFARWAMALHRVINGIRHDIRGADRIPRTGCLIALKHQSAWETFAFVPLVDQPVFILKQELLRIPVFGWWARSAGMIGVDRSGGVAALNRMTREARAAVEAGRQILIFPEGTRREPGAPPDYRLGVAHLYRDLGVPMIPVALNSGVYWPRRALTHRKGTIVAEVLPAIPAGLEARTAFRRMRGDIEGASDRLLLEAAEAGVPLGATAAARVADLRGSVTPAA